MESVDISNAIFIKKFQIGAGSHPPGKKAEYWPEPTEDHIDVCEIGI